MSQDEKEFAKVSTALFETIAEQIRTLRTRDEIPVSEAHVAERASNIAAGILGTFDVRLPDD